MKSKMEQSLPQMKNESDEILHTRIPEPQAGKLKALAVVGHRSASAQVMVAIDEYLSFNLAEVNQAFRLLKKKGEK